MLLKIKILSFLFVISNAYVGLGAEMIISGKYQGKNLYVQNPFAVSKNEYCTEEVFVNDKLVLRHPDVSAYEIDLSYLPLNSPIVIRIIYREGCSPSIVNPEVIAFDAFKFITLQVDEEEVKWIAVREPSSGTYAIERLEEGIWVEVAHIAVKGRQINNFYKLSVPHLPGKNTYRIKMTQPEGLTLYSREVSYQNP